MDWSDSDDSSDSGSEYADEVAEDDGPGLGDSDDGNSAGAPDSRDSDEDNGGDSEGSKFKNASVLDSDEEAGASSADMPHFELDPSLEAAMPEDLEMQDVHDIAAVEDEILQFEENNGTGDLADDDDLDVDDEDDDDDDDSCEEGGLFEGNRAPPEFYQKWNEDP